MGIVCVFSGKFRNTCAICFYCLIVQSIEWGFIWPMRIVIQQSLVNRNFTHFNWIYGINSVACDANPIVNLGADCSIYAQPYSIFSVSEPRTPTMETNVNAFVNQSRVLKLTAIHYF